MDVLILLACMANPLVIDLSVPGAILARRAWHVGIAALVPAILIGAVGMFRVPPLLMLGYLLGGLLWTSLAWAVKRQFMR